MKCSDNYYEHHRYFMTIITVITNIIYTFILYQMLSIRFLLAFLNILSAGEVSTWNFPKFHNLKHLIPYIVLFGCLENVSGNSPELAHKGIAKVCATCHNNRDIALGITKYNARKGNLQRVRHQARALAGADGDEIGERSDSDSEDEHSQESTLPCIVAVKYPLFNSTFHPESRHMRCETFGKKQRGLQRINLHTTGIDSLQTRAFPNLKYLPHQIAQYAFDYLHEKLGLPMIAEGRKTIPDLDSIIHRYIAADPRDGTHVQTFGAVAFESDRMAGIVRARARPFSNDKWYEGNPQDAVFMIPGLDVWDGSPEDLDTRNPDHVNMISYGKVVLFFSIRFVSVGTGYDKVHQLCLVEELLELKRHRDAGNLRGVMYVMGIV
jgi:hypothetical protein